MGLVVQKYGGASLASIQRIQAVAKRITGTHQAGKKVVVVVSAMGNTTDRLYCLARKVHPMPPPRELDMLLSAGERQTMALLSMAIMRYGEVAQSFTGSQVGIITDHYHTDARIEEIRLSRLTQALRAGKIPIVAGFQGMSNEREITTLGRGGSDVTAVALAAVLGADLCELFKDVDGIFTENPQEFTQVRHIPELTFTELAELAQAGAEVIHPRACALAEKYRVPLIIRSSFNNKRGTMVKEKEKLEKAFVRAITHQHKLVRVALMDVKKKPRCLHQVITKLTAARVPILLFDHGIPHGDNFDLIFIIPKTALPLARPILEQLTTEIGAKRLNITEKLCSVSLIGPGVGTDMEIVAETFDTLHQAKIHLEAFALTATRLTCVIDQKDLRIAVTALLTRFRLTRRQQP
ncbi:MAG: aspartate kinase [candidate division WOR-3 bacterium]